MFAVLMMSGTVITTALYLTIHIQTLKKCQPIFVATITWLYTVSITCLDFIIQLLVSKQNKTINANKSNQGLMPDFNILSFCKTTMLQIFRKINKICLLWYIIIIGYMESVKGHLMYPIR